MDLMVPVGCTATVYVPAENDKKVRESDRKPAKSREIIHEGVADGYAIYKVGSGEYSFFSPH
jgi:hypothetical protein